MNKIRNIQPKLLTFLTILAILTSSLSFIPQKVIAKKITTTNSKCTIPIQVTAWNKTCTLPKFDKTLGTLLSATIKGSVNTETIWKIENRDAGGADFSLTVGANADFKDPVTGRTTTSLFSTSIGGVNISGIVSNQTLTKSLTPYDDIFDSNGTSGRTYDGITPNTADGNAIYPKIITSKTDSKTLTDTDSLNFFSGNIGDIFATNITTKGRTITDYDTTNFTQKIDTIAGATTEVIYEYESPNVAINFDNLPVIAVPGVDFVFNLQVQNMETSPTPSGVRATLTLPNGISFDPNSFVFAGWTATLTGNVVTLVRNNPMAANLTEKLPIKLTITNSAPTSIPLIAKVIIQENDYDLTNNDKTTNVPKNLPPILSTISPFSVVNNNTIFKLPTNILGATDPNSAQADSVQSFVIAKIPDFTKGEFFLDGLGTIPVTLNQILTTEQANNLYFKPKSGFIGNVSFEFSANDTFGAKNPPITTSFNLTNVNSQSGTGQYYGTNTGTITLSNNSNSNQNSQNIINSANSQTNSQNITNNSTSNSINNSQFIANSNSQNTNGQNSNNSNQINLDQNLPKKVIFRLINNQLVDQNGEKINSNNEILIEKNGEINKDKINQIIQNYLKNQPQNQVQNEIENENRNNKKVLIQTQNIKEIFIEQNGKILSKITANDKSSNNSNQVVVVFKTENKTENSQNETDSNYTSKIQNLVRTGGLENLGQIGIGILAILSAVGLLWAYFTKLGKGKNENKIELGEQIKR